MSDPTPAQQEFADFLAKNSTSSSSRLHPEDREDDRDARQDDISEEDAYRNAQIDAAMRIPAFNTTAAASVDGAFAADLKLPPASFDAGRTTGVKGVIADARAYEMARRSKWMSKVRAARKSVFGDGHGHGHSHGKPSLPSSAAGSESDEDANLSDLQDEEAFLAQWRESRRRELESETSRAVRNRRTSPSVRIYGRMDEVDALGYLDAIEKVGRETVVVVFVYDHECPVSATVESAMLPLVGTYPTVHFVKVHYEDIEFDNAGVPAILAYRNQGDLFANLTGIIEMIPDDEVFGSEPLRKLFQKQGIL